MTGFKVYRRNAILQHPEHEFMLANLDRAVLVPGDGRVVLECKSTSAYLSEEWKDERVPLAYQAQVQWQLAITGVQYAFIASLIGGNKFTYTRIDRDEEVIAALIQAAADFWKHVVDNTMPPVDGSEKCGEALANLYPESKGEEAIELPPTIKPSELEYYFRMKAQVAEVEDDMRLVENKVKAELGDHARAWCGDYKVFWPTVTSRRLDTKRLKADHPDIYDEYAGESVTRRFTIKKGA